MRYLVKPTWWHWQRYLTRVTYVGLYTLWVTLVFDVWEPKGNEEILLPDSFLFHMEEPSPVCCPAACSRSVFRVWMGDTPQWWKAQSSSPGLCGQHRSLWWNQTAGQTWEASHETPTVSCRGDPLVVRWFKVALSIYTGWNSLLTGNVSSHNRRTWGTAAWGYTDNITEEQSTQYPFKTNNSTWISKYDCQQITIGQPWESTTVE